MTKKKTLTNVVSEDGLRFKAKTVGSPFQSSSLFQKPTMSCFKCGTHRPREELVTKRLLGSPRAVCAGGCAKN